MTPDRRVRRLEPVDALVRPEGVLVLYGQQLLRLGDIAADVFQLAAAPVSLASLAKDLEERHGAPPEGDVLEATTAVVDDLVASGVLAWVATPLAVTFVCTGNTCRSAYADVMARHLLGSADDRLVVGSGGIHAGDGGRMSSGMARLAAERGASTAGFRTRRADAGVVADADVLLTATVGHRDDLLRDHPDAEGRVFTLAQFADAADAAADGLSGAALVAWVAGHAAVAHPAGDVLDPLSRGAASERACADQIDALLARVIPRLAGPATPAAPT